LRNKQDLAKNNWRKRTGRKLYRWPRPWVWPANGCLWCAGSVNRYVFFI